MFPSAGASVDYNEAGEPTGWDGPAYYEPDYDPYDYDDDAYAGGYADDGDEADEDADEDEASS